MIVIATSYIGGYNDAMFVNSITKVFTITKNYAILNLCNCDRLYKGLQRCNVCKFNYKGFYNYKGLSRLIYLIILARQSDYLLLPKNT